MRVSWYNDEPVPGRVVTHGFVCKPCIHFSINCIDGAGLKPSRYSQEVITVWLLERVIYYLNAPTCLKMPVQEDI